MNTRAILVRIFLLTSSLAPVCSAASIGDFFDANSSFVANELGANETNSTFGEFSVGYADYADAVPFATFGSDAVLDGHTNAFAGNANTQGFLTNNDAIVPAAVVNVSSDPNSGFSGLDAGEILLHPGGRSASAFTTPFFDGVLRFSAPSDGFYNVTGAFRSLDSGVTSDTIRLNGAAQLTITDAGAFNFTLHLFAGDKVDFAVGAGSDGIGADSTGLRAKLTVTAEPPPPVQKQSINIDFNGKRPGDADSAGTYVGQGAGGGGTVFNGIDADSTGGNDNLAISASGLLNADGAPTTVHFAISPVAGDNEPSQSFEPASLYDDYIFNHTADNHAATGGSPFSLTGLGSVTKVDLYFYLNSFNAGTISIDGDTDPGISGTYNGLSALAFLDVPVVDGNVSGLFGANGAVSVLGGLSIVYVPEPTSALLLGFGALMPLLRRRRSV